MNAPFTSLVLGCLLLHPAPLCAEGPIVTKEASFVLHLHADPATAFPLFDPVNESRWGPDWHPRLLGERVHEGLVFLVGEGDARTAWFLDRYDAVAHRIGYVYFKPSVLTRISIAVEPSGSESIATVTYAKTALDEGAQDAVDRFAAHFPSQAQHWENALNAELARSKRS